MSVNFKMYNKLKQIYYIDSFDNVKQTGSWLYNIDKNWITNLSSGKKYKNMSIVYSWKMLIAMSNGLIINLDTDETLKIKTNYWNDFYITNNGYIITISEIYNCSFELLDYFYPNIIEIFENKIYTREFFGFQELDIQTNIIKDFECNSFSNIFITKDIVIACHYKNIIIYDLKTSNIIYNYDLGIFFKPKFSGRFLHFYCKNKEILLDIDDFSLVEWNHCLLGEINFIKDNLFGIYHDYIFSIYKIIKNPNPDILIQQFNSMII